MLVDRERELDELNALLTRQQRDWWQSVVDVAWARRRC